VLGKKRRVVVHRKTQKEEGEKANENSPQGQNREGESSPWRTKKNLVELKQGGEGAQKAIAIGRKETISI